MHEYYRLIVSTPKEAIRTFYSSGLEFLVLGDFVIPKDPSQLSLVLEAALPGHREAISDLTGEAPPTPSLTPCQ
jgi:hypothetical protein